eukprot:1293398-Rhodomonas_salina.3
MTLLNIMLRERRIHILAADRLVAIDGAGQRKRLREQMEIYSMQFKVFARAHAHTHTHTPFPNAWRVVGAGHCVSTRTVCAERKGGRDERRRRHLPAACSVLDGDGAVTAGQRRALSVRQPRGGGERVRAEFFRLYCICMHEHQKHTADIRITYHTHTNYTDSRHQIRH